MYIFQFLKLESVERLVNLWIPLAEPQCKIFVEQKPCQLEQKQIPWPVDCSFGLFLIRQICPLCLFTNLSLKCCVCISTMLIAKLKKKKNRRISFLSFLVHPFRAPSTKFVVDDVTTLISIINWQGTIFWFLRKN